MVRNYKRKTDRGKTPPDVLKQAAESVSEQRYSIRMAAEAYNINFMTLFRYVKKLKSGKSHLEIKTGYAKPRQIFSDDQENELAEYIKHSSKIFFGLSTTDVKSLAFEYAKENQILMPSNWYENKKSTKDWLLGFLKRNSYLSLRKPEPTSLSRMTSFNKHNVTEFFNNLGGLYDKYGFRCHQVWNLDETGVTTVQRPCKIIAEKGVKQVGSATSAERGNLVTVIHAVNAAGNSIPPLLIFPRKYFKEHFITDGPPGCIGAANPSGWVTSEEFLIFMKHFVSHTRCTKQQPVLVILDNHTSHMSINVINYCRENGVVLLSIPPHTSHRLQPLDKSVFGPLKTYYNSACDAWMKSNPGKTMVIYNIPTLLKTALQSASTPRNITIGFQSTGIWPFNKDIFTEEDFMQSEVTNRPYNTPENSKDNSDNCINLSAEIEPGNNVYSEVVVSIDSPSCSTTLTQPEAEAARKLLSVAHKSPEVIRPYPKAQKRKCKTNRRKITSCVLTSTPMKNILEEEQAKRKSSVTKKTGETKRKLFSTDHKKKKSQDRPKRHNRSKRKRMQVLDSSDDEDEDCLCLKCLKPWGQSKDGEEWIQCLSCNRWAHASCASNSLYFICFNCASDVSDD